jgi:hypothetical protein
MTEADVAALTTRVLWAAFALGVLFGAITQRTHFCTMGAIADVVAMGDWSRARMWALAIGTAMIGFAGMSALGVVDPAKTFYTAPRLTGLSNLVGGAIFGFGMVLASGCGSKTLVRLGAGNLKSLVVFVVLGVAAFATMKGITAVLRVNTIDTVGVTLATRQDLPSIAAPLLGWSASTASLALGLGIGGALVAWALARAQGRSADVLLGGIGIGTIVVAAWWTSGHLGRVAEHPKTLEEVFVATVTGRMEGLTFVAPIGYTLDWLMFFSDTSKLATFGVVSALGVIAGAAAVALLNGSFRLEGFASAEDTANHLIGAVLMGVGGVTSMGCTIGQGITGVSTLALGSFVALVGIVAGAVAALRWQMWRVERMS